LPSDSINALGADRVEVMVTGVDVEAIKEVATDTLLNMMDTMKVEQIGTMGDDRKSQILESTGANFLSLISGEGVSTTDWPDPTLILEKPAFETQAEAIEEAVKAKLESSISESALAALSRLRI
jgi:hypothetical protein